MRKDAFAFQQAFNIYEIGSKCALKDKISIETAKI